MLSTHNNNKESSNSAPDVTRWVAPIAAWSMWEANPEGDNQPDIGFVNASLRRKVSTLTRMSLNVANACAGDLKNVRLVYASQHGDLKRTSKILDNLAEEEALSPTNFSMSVLNAFSGIYSIAKRDTSPSNSISSGFSTFGFGLLEACLQLKSHADTPVLYVYADEPAPEVYQVSNQDYLPHAIGILLSTEAVTNVECSMISAIGETTIQPQSLSFMNCLRDNHSDRWQGEGRLWTWRK